MDFGAALKALKAGACVAREGWNGKGMWIALTPGSAFEARHAKCGHAAAKRAVELHHPDAEIELLPHIDMRAADGSMVVGWLASQTDMLAEDWVVVGGSGALPAGVDLIADERARQIEVEGWTPEHDDTHKRGELAEAAACYAVRAGKPDPTPPGVWPWDGAWWKPRSALENLVRAGALIAAEIDRLNRAALSAASTSDAPAGPTPSQSEG